MPLSVDIPRIDITPEAEEDDDHVPLNISEALTDVEDLYDDQDPAPPQIKKKNKLKIKLSDDGGVTDLEDFEASSDDDGTQIIKHQYPVVMSDLDIEAPLTEESYRRQTSKGKRRMKTEFATKQKSFYQSEEESNDEGVVTDSEAYETENEPCENIPETDYNLDLYRTTENLVADNMAVDNISKPATSNHLLAVFSNQDGSTDIEVLRSDSDSDNAEIKKAKTKRRRHRGQRKPSATDLEEVYFSDENLAPKASRKPKRKQKLTKCNTLPLDSENEEGEKLPFPLCKRIAKKNMPSLIIPDEFDLNFQTDVEDIEADQDLDVPGLIVDEEALDEQLKEIASGYGVVKEEYCNVKKDVPYRKPIIGVAIDIFTENCDTDDEVFQSELASGNNIIRNDDEDYQSEDVDDVKLFLRDDHADYKIKFSPSLQSLKLNTSRSQNNLALPSNNEDPLTDCENIDSSADEPYRKIPVAFVRQSETDEEEFVTDEDVKIAPFQDIQLPPPTRNLVLVQENDALVPTVRILPLDSLDYNNVDDNLDLGEQTDEESVSEAFDALDVEQAVIRGPTPDLPYLDGDLVNVLESVDKFCKSPIPIDSITDTEEVDLEPIRRKRAPKFKFMYEKSLSAKNRLNTDTEDLSFSDNPQSKSLVDDLEIRPLSVTPQHLGDSVVPRESSGPFSIIDKLELNKFSLNSPVTPATTDSEDMMASAEEDVCAPNHVQKDEDKEVMYLKGGGYNDADSDVECLEGIIAFDFKRFSVAFGCKEWDDSRKPKQVADQATLDAAQQGAEQAHSTSSQQATSSTKAETEDSRDKGAKDKSKKVSDQHQLSDEMQQLLKEMEKESKQ